MFKDITFFFNHKCDRKSPIHITKNELVNSQKMGIKILKIKSKYHEKKNFNFG